MAHEKPNPPPDALRVPEGVAATLTALYGERAWGWIAGYPALVREVAARWDLAVGRPFAPLSFHMVLRARRRDGTRAVLKLGVPNRELETEAAALGLYGGAGCARLLDADTALGALLLERAMPGTALAPMVLHGRDDEATAIAAGVMRRLRKAAPPDAAFPTVAEWFGDLDDLRARQGGRTDPLPTALVEAAAATHAELAAGAAPPVVLHGDLHHGNVLDAGRGAWIAIDPKGVLGEPAYEAGALLRNPMPDILTMGDLGRITARRLDILAERLGLDRHRLKRWAFAQAVLSACWSLEEGSDAEWRTQIAVAEVLARPAT